MKRRGSLTPVERANFYARDFFLWRDSPCLRSHFTSSSHPTPCPTISLYRAGITPLHLHRHLQRLPLPLLLRHRRRRLRLPPRIMKKIWENLQQHQSKKRMSGMGMLMMRIKNVFQLNHAHPILSSSSEILADLTELYVLQSTRPALTGKDMYTTL